MTLTDAKDLATIIGVAAAVTTLAKGLWEYSRSSVLRRMEHFAKIKEEFLTDIAFAKLTELLETERAAPSTEPVSFHFGAELASSAHLLMRHSAWH